MPERIKITVRASGAHPDVLTVQDAMRQVLDLFELLTNEGDDLPGVEWKLAKASTNSPFYMEGEAVSLQPSVDVTVVARAQKQALSKSLREIVSGRLPADPDFEVKIAQRVLARNLNGVGSTEIDLEIGEPIKLTPQIAREAIQALDRRSSNDLYDIVHPREEIGSIEGTLMHVGTHWNAPAIRILDSRTKVRVWCRLSAALERAFANKTTFDDVWKHRRVRVRGRIKYEASGDVNYVLASDVQKIEEKEVSLSELRDAEFTSGLSVVEYLDRFRDGSLG